jgi:F-type H+-transporting ATPase subunit b
MLDFVAQFAETAEVARSSGGSDIFGPLGIDWQTMILQIISFAILVFILAKFIYPSIKAMLDRRDKTIADSMKAAKEAEEKAAASEAETTKLLERARTEAGDIVETAKKESSDMIAGAEADAAKRADAIVANAKVELDREVESARQTLRNEVVDLVALATEKVVETKIDAQDEKIIKSAIKERK